MRDRMNMRVPTYAGPQERAPISVYRARAVVGTDTLSPADAADGGPQLTVPAGAIGDAERALGLADPAHALACVCDLATDDVLRRDISARAALMGGDVPGARAALGDARHAQLAAADAVVLLAEQDVAGAKARLAEVLAHTELSTTIAGRYAQALVHVADGDLHAAHGALVDVARAAPWHAVARYQLGQLLLATGDPARAGTLFEMASVIAPNFVAPVLTLAEMLADSRQYGEALNLIQGACEKNPEATAPRVLQLRILIEVGEQDAALNLAQMLRERAPHDAEIGLLYAEALVEAERKGEALAVLDGLGTSSTSIAQRQRGQRLRARLLMGETPAREKEALAVLIDAAGLDGPLTGELLLEQFHVAWGLGQKDDAERALHRLHGLKDASSIISGAILARSHALWPQARTLAENARGLVLGTPAEGQLDGFLASLP